jgi:hypothetical protein
MPPPDKIHDSGNSQRRRRHDAHENDEEIAAGTISGINNNNIIIMDSSSSPSAAAAQRSLLQSLWSEATSTTDLHQRRNKIVRKSSGGQQQILQHLANSSSSSKRSHGKKYNHGYNSRRMKRVATRVWLTAVAALALALVIKIIHVFLYGVLIARNKNKGDLSSSILAGSSIEGVDAATIQKLLDQHNIDVEDTYSKMTLHEAHSHKLTPFPLLANNNNIDTSQYTIRMNTWHRNEQLLLSVNHHAQCTGVAEIQIIWCDTQTDPPDNIVQHPSGKVKIERHGINSLNERFKIILDTPTLAILSLDDDVLRPCEALDAAFIRWVRHPERMVGFDVRTHVVESNNRNSGGSSSSSSSSSNKAIDENHNRNIIIINNNNTNWKYGYMSTTEKSNSYSLTLPRASFLHKDYLDLYIMAMPRPIYLYVAQHFECEDIAMSFFVSSLTGGKPPLITDYWAVKSMVKLYSETKISGGKDHKSARDKCVDHFAELLGVKEGGEWGPLQKGELVHDDGSSSSSRDRIMFGYGAEPEDWDTIDESLLSSTRLKELVGTMKVLTTKSYNDQLKWLKGKKYETMKEAKKVGMIENTDEWEERWKSGGRDEET